MSSKKAVINSLLLPLSQKFRLPQTLIFFVTSRCNARCEFCLYKEQVANPVAKSQELSVDEVSNFAKNYGPLHYLALSGGEPFVRNDIADICQVFIDSCDTKVIDIPSNFFYKKNMIESMNQLLEKNNKVIFDLQFSLDHLGEKHDLSRKVRGLYEKSIETFKSLEKLRDKYRNFKFKIN